MKIKIYLLAIVTIFTIFSCSEDVLNTDPTDKASGETVFETTENAYTAMNGIYRAFYVYGSQWVDYYETENSGIAAMQLAHDLMAEDVLMDKSGSGWFWYDYRFWVRSEVNSTGDRPYSWWNMHYQLINNANYILANIDNANGLVEDKHNIKAQAYALRAYCYFNLIRLYQRTYVGHQGDPGVPLYTEPSNAKTEGKGRGTVEMVYTQINADLDSSIARFQDASARRHISHINLNVAHGLKARVALTQENWAAAQTHAALAKTGITLMSTTEMLGGFNTVVNPEWMWASEVNEEQSLSWPSFWSHVDASVDGSYANRARRCIFSWLYNQIPATDVRKQWFNGVVGTPSTGPNFNYNQLKFEVKAAGSWSSDLLYMRGSEMYLIEAEAQCMLGNYPEARTLLTAAIGYKDPSFAATLAAIPNGNTLNLGSTGPVNNLLDYIILQRRIELWGEGFRGFDVQRLKTGFSRVGGNHPVVLTITDPESWQWIMMIPQKEFDGNKNMNSVTDQNP
jgi:starch-binding outer membrane protein, SusD/RagB family